MPHWIIIPFVFAFGACVGSFLNVVVYRMPLGRSLVSPPSSCPGCGHQLAWRDNIPVLGWIVLGGHCRYCKASISARYPVIELLTGLLFVASYTLMFLLEVGPCTPMMSTVDRFGLESLVHRPFDLRLDLPTFILSLALISTLLAVSLIDAEHFIIPTSIPLFMAIVGFAGHVLFDRADRAGVLLVNGEYDWLAWATAGVAVGWMISMLLLWGGVLKRSFADGEPMLDREQAARNAGETVELPAGLETREYTKAEIRREIGREFLFLLPMILLGVGGLLISFHVESASNWMKSVLEIRPISAGVGSLAGAIVGAGLVWITRVLGSLGFGKEAMGFGDVFLMFGVGAMIGAGPSVIAFFLAPFAGLAIAVYLLVFGRFRTIPYGPFLAIGSVTAYFAACPILERFWPGIAGLGLAIRSLLGG